MILDFDWRCDIWRNSSSKFRCNFDREELIFQRIFVPMLQAIKSLKLESDVDLEDVDIVVWQVRDYVSHGWNWWAFGWWSLVNIFYVHIAATSLRTPVVRLCLCRAANSRILGVFRMESGDGVEKPNSEKDSIRKIKRIDIYPHQNSAPKKIRLSLMKVMTRSENSWIFKKIPRTRKQLYTMCRDGLTHAWNFNGFSFICFTP